MRVLRRQRMSAFKHRVKIRALKNFAAPDPSNAVATTVIKDADEIRQTPRVIVAIVTRLTHDCQHCFTAEGSEFDVGDGIEAMSPAFLDR